MGNMGGGADMGGFIPPELMGDMSGGGAMGMGGGGDAGGFIPPELMGDMSGGADVMDFVPPELMGNMEAAFVQKSKPAQKRYSLVQNV